MFEQGFLETPRRLSHPAMPDWYATAFEFPKEAEACLKSHYSHCDPSLNAMQVHRIIDDVKLATIQTTVYRKELEGANLHHLGLSEAEIGEYKNFAGKLALAGENVVWFANKAARAFKENPSRDLKKISLELGGNRQYGLWSVTKEVDDIVWELGDQLVTQPAATILRRYEYESKTPIRYRFWPRLNTTWNLNDIHSGNVQRRRGVLDVLVETPDGPIEVRPYKRASGLMVFDAIKRARVDELLRRYQNIAEEESDNERTQIENAADTYAGTIFREAIRNKAFNPHGVAPIDAVLVMVAHRPDWALAA